MDTYIDFILDNYILIMIVLLVIIFSVIGYLADKRGFLKKKSKTENIKDGTSKEIENNTNDYENIEFKDSNIAEEQQLGVEPINNELQNDEDLNPYEKLYEPINNGEDTQIDSSEQTQNNIEENNEIYSNNEYTDSTFGSEESSSLDDEDNYIQPIEAKLNLEKLDTNEEESNEEDTKELEQENETFEEDTNPDEDSTSNNIYEAEENENPEESINNESNEQEVENLETSNEVETKELEQENETFEEQDTNPDEDLTSNNIYEIEENENSEESINNKSNEQEVEDLETSNEEETKELEQENETFEEQDTSPDEDLTSNNIYEAEENENPEESLNNESNEQEVEDLETSNEEETKELEQQNDVDTNIETPTDVRDIINSSLSNIYDETEEETTEPKSNEEVEHIPTPDFSFETLYPTEDVEGPSESAEESKLTDDISNNSDDTDNLIKQLQDLELPDMSKLDDINKEISENLDNDIWKF